MGWRTAKALLALRSEVNRAYPNRDKRSDGTIGDAAHASRSSDHNPWVGPGIVTALDITNDLGITDVLWEHLRATRDPRIKYMIYKRQIVSSTTAPWRVRYYGGSNPHTKHLHISVKADARHYDNDGSWGAFEALSENGVDMSAIAQEVKMKDSGPAVFFWQRIIRWIDGKYLPKYGTDSDYGAETQTAVADICGGDGREIGPREAGILLTRLAETRGYVAVSPDIEALSERMAKIEAALDVLDGADQTVSLAEVGFLIDNAISKLRAETRITLGGTP